ncbi:CDP-glycerol glycerophosphotransferase family protein [Fredinandcohnia onubensis]|uniref:CDP-glycerol glycerophosphotransferase family protein n=1 Tax=Fredinandcohnia onubensis TaxID=1571209 RepID=UPI000C0C0A63|nr:CDP-glycerol glycerophosphotransferase family protein [Fredinandcohnia onubensis]
MNSIYYRNYWGLFADFVEAFEKLTYRNIPLTLVGNFQSYLTNRAVREIMKSETLIPYIKNQFQRSDEIQPFFDRYLKVSAYKNIGNKKGKSLILQGKGDHLRFPIETFIEYFHPTKCIFLHPQKEITNNYIHPNIGPTHYLDDYKSSESTSTKIIEEANDIFKKYYKHPVFSHENFRSKFLSAIPKIIELIIAFEEYLKKVPISSLIVGNTNGMFTRTLTQVAALKGIPSICTQHGIIANEIGFLPIFATKHAVFGNYEKDWYKTRGVNEDRIEITGHPRFDRIFTHHTISKTSFLSKFNIKPNKKIVLIATNAIQNKKALQSLVEKLSLNPILEIIIKPHPKEVLRNKLKPYRQITSISESVHLSTKMELYDLLENVDIVVQQLSTVAIEAMLFNKPVFFMKESTNYNMDNQYYFESIGKFAYKNPEDLAKKINEYFHSELFSRKYTQKIQEFIKYSYPEVFAGRNIAKTVYKLTGTFPYQSPKSKFEGRLIKDSSNRIYLIQNGMKRLIHSKALNSISKAQDILLVKESIILKIPHGLKIQSL